MIMSMLQATPFSSPGIVDGKNIATTTDYSDGLTLPFTGGGAMNYYSSGGTGGYYHYNNNKLQLDLALDQKLDFITKGLAFKLKGSYNNMFNVTKGGTVGRASYFPVIQEDGSILYRKEGEKYSRQLQ